MMNQFRSYNTSIGKRYTSLFLFQHTCVIKPIIHNKKPSSAQAKEGLVISALRGARNLIIHSLLFDHEFLGDLAGFCFHSYHVGARRYVAAQVQGTLHGCIQRP